MTFIDDDSVEGSAFIWTIDNFSYCLLEAGHCLQSPKFTLYTNTPSTFQLRVYPKGTDFNDIQDEMYFGLCLDDAFVSNRKVEFTLSVQTTGGTFKKIEDLSCDFSSFYMHGHIPFLKREELLEEAETFLDNDAITLRCRIVKIDGDLIAPGRCYARTVIHVERVIKSWSFEDFRQNMSPNEIAEKKLSSSISLPKQQANVALVINFEGDSDAKMNLEIQHTDKYRKCCVVCDLYLLETGGRIVHSIRDKHWFDASDIREISFPGLVYNIPPSLPRVWTIPYLQLSKVLECEKPYLRCELAIVSGNEYSWVERVENGKIDDRKPTSANIKEKVNVSDSLKDDLQRFHLAGMLTDMTVRTARKDFAVHKAILCARSTVFHAMFEQDMKENRTGVVSIEDVGADTVQKMLRFAYSDTVEDLDCDQASKLYFAADKYKITALRRKCSDIFKKNLSVVNVCEALVLADMHQDEYLKSVAEDFIVGYTDEVMHSVEWKTFTKKHVTLASEIMLMLLMQKN